MVRWLAVFVWLGLARVAWAHDGWLMPNELVRPEPGAVRVSLFIGEAFVPEYQRAFEAAGFLSFEHHFGREREGLPLFGMSQREAPVVLAGFGGHLLVADRSAATIELEPAKFEEYLRSEGLARVVEERARRGESSNPGRERYRRFLKTLIQVGNARDDVFGRVVGQPLELVPQQNPVFVEPGTDLGVQLLFHGEPLAGALVEAFSTTESEVRHFAAQTDEAGRVSVPIDRRAVWLLRTVHMVRCERVECAPYDWESFWGAYTFASVAADGATVRAPVAPVTPARGKVDFALVAFGAAAVGLTLAALRRH